LNPRRLIVCGDSDKPVPLETASQVLADKIPNAKLLTIRDAGHFPHMENPEIFNEALWMWMEENVQP
jgi:pimeloyl-ACP methyl ester carboxylesterase